MEHGTIKIIVWEENQCDEDFSIIDSTGFSLDTLNQINESFKNLDWTKERGLEMIIKPNFEEAQIGDYPPPNIEVPSYWDYEVICKIRLEELYC